MNGGTPERNQTGRSDKSIASFQFPINEFTLFHLSKKLNSSGIFLTKVEVWDTFGQVMQGILGCLQQIGERKFYDLTGNEYTMFEIDLSS